MLEDFCHEFLDWYRYGPEPDLDMKWLKNGPVLRYFGPGGERHHYSLRINEPCDDLVLLEQLVDAENKIAKSFGRKFEWKVYSFPKVPGLAALLEYKGLKCTRRTRMLFLPVDQPLSGVAPSAEVMVEKVTTRWQIEALASVLADVWNDTTPSFAAALWAEISGRAPLTEAWLASVDGQVVSCCWIKYYGRIGFLFGGATRAAFRGKGAYRALVQVRQAAAQNRGVKYLVSECSPDSEKVLRGLGFLDAGESYLYEYEFESIQPV